MTKIQVFSAGAALVVGVVAAPAQASYSKKCDELISAWEACLNGGGACKAAEKRIEEECKCHRKRQGSYKLVTAAVGKNDVCRINIPNPTPTPNPPPPPPPPPKPEPVITYGGERGPGQRAPNASQQGKASGGEQHQNGDGGEQRDPGVR